MQQHFKIGASLLTLGALAGCGGGSVNSAGSTPAINGITGSGGSGPTITMPAPSTKSDPAPATPAPDPTPTPAPVYAAPVAPPAGYVVTPKSLQPVRSANDTSEYRANYEAAEYVNALYALDNGWNGHGVTVGLIDDGVNTAATTEFTGQIDATLSKDFGVQTDANGQKVDRNGIGDANSTHGTSVGAIIAAAANGTGVEGMAAGAQLAVLRVDDESTDASGTVTKVLTGADAAIGYAASARLKVVNMSLAPIGLDPMMAASATAYAKTGGLIVNSAGNDAGTDPISAPEVTADNRQAWLFVGALDPTGTGYQLTSYSNKAGSMADRYVVAPGTSITIDVNGKTTSFSGTSAAAPVVTALAADILSKWPQLSGQDAGNIILNTATAIGDAATFGKGIVNFQAALAPVNPTLTNGSAAASSQSVNTSGMMLSSVVGVQGLQKALSNVTILDAYGRNYSGSLAGAIVQAASQDGHWMRRRIRQMADGNQSDIAIAGISGSVGYVSYAYGPQPGMVTTRMTNADMAFAYGKWTFTAGLNQANNVQSDIMGLAPFSDAVMAYSPMVDTSVGATYAIGPDRRIGMTFSTGGEAGYGAVNAAHTSAASLSYEQGGSLFRMSVIQEHGSVFGYASSGGLMLGSGATSSVFEARHDFALAGGWSLQGYGSIGVTRLAINGSSVVTGASALISSRLGFQANGPALGGVLSLGAAQPLRVERGNAHLTLSTGYDLASESLVYSHETASLATRRREVQLTAGYAHAAPGGAVRLGIAQSVTIDDRRAMAAYAMRF